MRTAALFAYFIFPAVLYFALGAVDGDLGSVSDEARFFLPNYLFYAAPQLAWFALAAVFRARPPLLHAGLIGATVALSAVSAAFVCCINNSNGLGWLGYWPVAITFMLAAIGITSLIEITRQNR